MNRLHSDPDLTCAEVQDTLEAYLADELEADIHTVVASHIASCLTCQDEVRFVRAINEVLIELPKPEPPPQVFKAVSTYIRAHPSIGEGWRHRIFQIFRFTDDLPSALARVGASVCLIGILLFGGYQYQQYRVVKQASRDFSYALSQLNYAVKRTGLIVIDKLPDVQINEISNRPFVQIENVSRRILKKRKNISSAIHRSLDVLNRAPQNVLETENSDQNN